MVHETAFVHPHAAVTGNVVIGRDVYVGPGAAIRGDWGGIVIGDGCNVQENCIIHMFPGTTVVLEESARTWARRRSCTAARIGAQHADRHERGDHGRRDHRRRVHHRRAAFVAGGDRSSSRGRWWSAIPAKVVKDVTDEMIKWKTEGTRLYQSLPGMMRDSWREAEPLRDVPPDRPDQAAIYRTWKDSHHG